MDDRKKRLLLVIGGAVAFLAAMVVAAVFFIGLPREGDMLARLQSGLGAVTGGAPQGAAPRDFGFRRLEIDVTGPQPQACLVFTRALDGSGKTHYQDYLAIDPDTKVALRVVDSRLCVAGLAFDKTYNVTLKDGLPAADGSRLQSETVPVTLRDKPALVRFSGGIILPRENAAGVPVTTVNVDRLDLKVIRVGDRLLSQIESGTIDQTQLYGWDEKQLENAQGLLVWQGTMAVDNVKNASTVTQIPVHDFLKGQKPGAYVLVASDAAKKASDDDYGAQMAAQWVVDSDIALTSFTADRAAGGAGLTVFARSYGRAVPLEGVRMTLIARNNNQLASAVTDSSGRVDFDAGLMTATGGDQPVMVMAYGRGGDFTFLDLRRSAFDLTDRGVGGHPAPGPIDAWLYTDRGVYRPGETVRAVAMLRDRVGVALKAPLTLVAQRPDGIEVGRKTVSGDQLLEGGAGWNLSLSPGAPHGRWQISAYVDPKAQAVGRVQFDVADFVPQRLKVTLTAREKQIAPGEDFHVRAEARFLYGAPGASLTGDGEATIAADPDPWPQYKGYRFGRVDDSFSETKVALVVPQTDAAGITTITGNTGTLAQTTLPLKAVVRVSIHEPGGRTTDRSITLPIRGHGVSIGIRADFDGEAVAENARAGFEAIALDHDGKRVALPKVTVSWVREDTTYQWFQSNGEWRYQPVTRDRLVTSGTMALAAGAPLKLEQRMGWGTWRLTITDPASGAASSYRFYSGWAASSAGDRPDRIPVAADKPAYAPGSVAHVRIKPDANGKALVVIASDKIFSSRLIDAPASGTMVDIPVSADWGAGAYVLVTHYRPLSQVTGRAPVRAIGVTWIGVDNRPRTLGVTLNVPGKLRPRQTISVPVKLTGLASEAAYVTVAAVDEGILQLTDFKSPDPADHYFGKRRLGVAMRDDYGRLIRNENGAVGSLRQGGDSFGGRTLAVVPQKTVALFSGIVKVDRNGTALVRLAIPDFNGALRLMAVAWSGDKLGHGDKLVVVRDPVVADLVLPRFLAPGDNAAVALNLDNVEGAAGPYTATITVQGPLALTDSGKISRSLARGQRLLVPVALSGTGIGTGHIRLAVQGPGGFHVTHDWPIMVRAPQMDQTREEETPLAAGASYVATRALTAGLAVSGASVNLTVSAAHGWANTAGLLKWLDKYPFGCLEQTVSAAQPLLLFNEVAASAGVARDVGLKARIQTAIDQVLDMQGYGGGFGMWGPGDDADPFIGVYAMDFLIQARARGYVISDDALRRGDSWLRGLASGGGDDLSRAYAFYVLAGQGQANVSDLRYFSDTRVSKMSSALAAALTGAAAAAVGDRSRTEYGFARARSLLADARPATYPHDVYGSLLRDLSATLALAADSGKTDLIPWLMDKARGLDMRAQYTTTQEKGWMLRAAWALTRQKVPLAITVNGVAAKPVQGAVRLAPTLKQLDAGLTITNRGGAEVWRTTSVSGTPDAPLAAMANGLSLSKSIWTMTGAPADITSLRQNDRVIIEISGRMPDNVYHQMGIVDLLPAGLEIEQPLKGEDAKAYPFLGTLSAATSQVARDDRFIATFDIGQRYRPRRPKGPEPMPEFHVAYIARAVAVGRFALPAATAQDMYAPAITARTAMGRVTIKAP